MNKADEMNLVEAISLLKEMQDNALIACRCYKTSGILDRDEKAEQKVNAIDTVLNYIENSIPKEKVEELIKNEIINLSGLEIITVEDLQELLEGK